MASSITYDILHPSNNISSKQHKLKRLIQSPNSYYIDILCSKCNSYNIMYSHISTNIYCKSCDHVIALSTGGKANITIGCKYRKVSHRRI